MQLSEWRKAEGLTQAQLAMKLNVSPVAVSRWETGARKPEWKRDGRSRMASHSHRPYGLEQPL
jgi:transcriptional regulator with XRE-family HTH domain